MGCVLAARSAHAIDMDPAARASVFEPIAWAATPGFVFPCAFDPVRQTADLGPEIDEMTYGGATGVFLKDIFPRWSERPGAIGSTSHVGRMDIAFGRHQSSTGNGPSLPTGTDPDDYHQLLQLYGNDEWYIGGDGGTMHWSILTGALRAGDFSQATPTPDLS
ncbi:hypothetical protein [Streptomyces sp. NBC_01727]|uniref:hypothetical protein n=1 Tax=Streptomyces sp. NBC_01727 TaxID=2975924 RepID=UPI002E12FC75|nr:hypothetical protein OIE76_40945 [Streptomyces sp. NBC_01727]